MDLLPGVPTEDPPSADSHAGDNSQIAQEEESK